MSMITTSFAPPLKISRASTLNLQHHSSATVPPVIPPILPPAHSSSCEKYANDFASGVLSSVPIPKVLPPLWLPSLKIASPTVSLASTTTSPTVSLASTTTTSPQEHQVVPNQQVTDDSIIEFKANSRPGRFQRMCTFMSNRIREYQKKSLAAFWVENPSNGAFLLFDLETMQQFNVSTGYRRSIRCINNKNSKKKSGKRKRHDVKSVDSIDLTNSSAASNVPAGSVRGTSIPVNRAQSSASNGIKQNISSGRPEKSCSQKKCSQKNVSHHRAVEICGSAYKMPVLCGQVARRKLAQIRLLQLSRCEFVRDMRMLPAEARLFNPDPIPEDDPRFPVKQIRHLDRGGITVHEILPNPTWSRNRRYFELLYEDEKQIYAAHATAEGPAKIKHFAWHGAPADCIRGILEYGFLVGPTPRVGNRYGHGVYLSTENYGRFSMNATYSQPDPSGFKFMLLCEVLPGTVEASKGQQTRPTKLSVHSGVDQLPGATMHVFYTFDMNVRICPKYLVVLHPPVTEAVMNLVPNELQMPTAIAVAETNEPSSGLVVIDCT